MARPKSRPRPGPAPPRPARQPPTEAERAFGARLRAAREEIQMKPGEAAKTLKIAPARISEYESGRVSPPVLRLLEMVRVLGYEPSTLIPEWFRGWERKKPKKSRN